MEKLLTLPSRSELASPQEARATGAVSTRSLERDQRSTPPAPHAAPFDFPIASRFDHFVPSPMRSLMYLSAQPHMISLTAGHPDEALFPYDDLRACFGHVMHHQAERALQYSATEGEPELREAAARWMCRQLPTTADQVQITSGSQEGLFLVAQAMVDPGDVVLVEQPTYLSALHAFQQAGASTIAVASDDDGVLPDDLAHKIAVLSPRFVYMIPTFQNPSGHCMSLQRRQQVADVLLRTGTPLVEDDAYGDLRYDGDPVPPLAALPGMSRQTLLLSTTSKSIAPGTRIGWVRGEGPILTTLARAKSAVGLQNAVLEQLAIARYLDTFDVEGHVAMLRRAYGSRRDAMVAALEAVLPSSATMSRPHGGMFCWVDLHDDTNTTEMLPTAIEHGVAYIPGHAFHASEPNDATMRLSFAPYGEELITTGVERLARALRW